VYVWQGRAADFCKNGEQLAHFRAVAAYEREAEQEFYISAYPKRKTDKEYRIFNWLVRIAFPTFQYSKVGNVILKLIEIEFCPSHQAYKLTTSLVRLDSPGVLAF
jgi:hypothetical protein